MRAYFTASVTINLRRLVRLYRLCHLHFTLHLLGIVQQIIVHMYTDQFLINLVVKQS